MEAGAAVARGDHRVAVLVPAVDDAFDRARIEIRAVCEDDDRGLRLGRQRGESAPQRRSRPALPLAAMDDALVDLDVVRAGHHDDFVHSRARAHAREDIGEEEPLLGRTEPAGLPRGQDDGGDHINGLRPNPRRPSACGRGLHAGWWNTAAV